MARVLLVDDDEDVQAVLGQYLAKDGHHVLPARTAAEVLASVDGGAPDVVILDLTLPDLDGLQVLRRLREAGQLPVLVLSARGEESDRLLGLGLGADDYVVKPFSPREVCLRVAALLRRSGQRDSARQAEGPFRYGPLTLWPEEHRVQVGEQEVSLTPREFALLELLLRHPRQVLSKERILAALWPEGFVSDHVVDVHLAALRRKLQGAVTIENVRGVGFRLSAEEGP